MKSIKKLIEDYGNGTVSYNGVLASKDQEFSKVMRRHIAYVYHGVATSEAFETLEYSYHQVQSCFLKKFN